MTENNEAKILIWDIETCGVFSNFKADMGWIICIGYKWLGEKETHVMKIDDYPRYKKDYTDDSQLIKDFYNLYLEADLTVAHFGSVFDRRFLEGRLVINGLPPLPETKLIDTCRIARSKFTFSSNRLAHLAKILGCEQRKSENNFPEAWFDLLKGGRTAQKSLHFLADYCKQDVRTLEDVYLKIRNRIVQHPHVGKIQGSIAACSCRICGSKRLKKNGTRITASGAKRQEVQCRDCGSYARIPIYESQLEKTPNKECKCKTPTKVD